MKDYCLELVFAQKSQTAKYNIMREYLQAYILRILQDQKLSKSLAFVGGTALRFLYGLPRFSEDLDFSQHSKPKHPFDHMMKAIEKELLLAGYALSMTHDESKSVHSAFIKFEGLLYEAKLSPMKTQKFSIKIEIDTHPPKGAVLQTSINNKFFPLAVVSYDLSSLLAGKMNAILTRSYTKGRDFYDLAWYLSKYKTLTPNFLLLKNALQQFGYSKAIPVKNNWRRILSDVVQRTDWKSVYNDVVNFLENSRDMETFTKENVLKLIQD